MTNILAFIVSTHIMNLSSEYTLNPTLGETY